MISALFECFTMVVCGKIYFQALPNTRYNFMSNILVICVCFKIYFPIDHHCKTIRKKQKILKFLQGGIRHLENCHILHQYLNSVADTGFPRGRGANSPGWEAAAPIDDFCQKFLKTAGYPKNFLDGGRGSASLFLP